MEKQENKKINSQIEITGNEELIEELLNGSQQNPKNTDNDEDIEDKNKGDEEDVIETLIKKNNVNETDEDDDNEDDNKDEKSVIKLKDKLSELGYVDKDYKPKDENDLLETAINNGIIEVLKELPEEVKELNKFVLNGGTIEDFMRLKSVDDFSEEAVENDEKIAETAIRKYYESKGLDSDEIEEQLELLKDSGKLIKFSKKIVPKLKKLKEKEKEALEKSKKEREKQAKQQIENRIKETQSFLKTVDEIEGIPLTKEDKKDLPEFMFKPKYKRNGVYVSDFQKNLVDILQDKEKSVILALMIKENMSVDRIKKILEDKITKDIQNNVRRVSSNTTSKKTKRLIDLF